MADAVDFHSSIDVSYYIKHSSSVFLGWLANWLQKQIRLKDSLVTGQNLF